MKGKTQLVPEGASPEVVLQIDLSPECYWSLEYVNDVAKYNDDVKHCQRLLG